MKSKRKLKILDGTSAVVRLSVLGLPSLLAGCTAESGLWGAEGPVAAAEKAHLSSIFWWMLLVALPVFLAVPVLLWRYRIGGRGRYRPDWDFSLPLELAIWAIPAVVVSVLGWNLWVETLRQDPYTPLPGGPPLQVQVVGYDWKWLFIYPGLGIASADALVLPAGRPVQFELTSASVLQSFMIPRLAGQIYAMPGMVTRLNLRADNPGRFDGFNTQYSGHDFPKQRFQARAVTQSDFDAWVGRVRAEGAPLDPAARARLAQRSVLARPEAFSQVPPDLFRQIVQATKSGRPSREVAEK